MCIFAPSLLTNSFLLCFHVDLVRSSLVGLSQVQSQCMSPCSAQWQCESCSTNYNFVQCIDSVCTCLTNQGFTGNATVANPCACQSPNTVDWTTGSPYCLNIALATQLQVNASRANTLIQQVMRVYNYLDYPTPLFILNGSLPLNDLFDPNVIARADPLSIVNGSQIVQEYFYVFAVQALHAQTPVVIYAVEFQELGCNMTTPNPVVFVRVIVKYGVFLPGGGFLNVVNYTQLGTFTFGLNNTIIKADLVIPNIGFSTNSQLLNRTLYRINTCNLYFAFCNATYDPLGYYTSFDDCMDFLTNHVRNTTYTNPNIPVDYDQPAGNTDVCRNFHLQMARYAPIPHCSHGGCVFLFFSRQLINQFNMMRFSFLERPEITTARIIHLYLEELGLTMQTIILQHSLYFIKYVKVVICFAVHAAWC